jgi:predicted ATPase
LGQSLAFTGDVSKALAHYDKGLALYNPAEHRQLAMRFSSDTAVAILSLRSLALWVLGYPEGALADVEHALTGAREISHAATSMHTATFASNTLIFCGNYAAANVVLDVFVALADEKSALFWKAAGMMLQGCVLALTDNASDAVRIITSAINAYRSTEATALTPLWLSYLARAHADLGQLDDAWRCIGEAMMAIETTKERWFDAEANRIAGEIALKSPVQDAAKAEAYFEHALSVARQQQAKSWELRAAMSMARLWRDQGKRDEARELLAPVYGWFTEGFDTRDLKEAKSLLDELS